MINLLVGDALVRLKELDDNSVHSIVCDPPYGLGDPPPIREVLLAWLNSGRFAAKGVGFMQKKWDAFVPSPDIWQECFRVLKPGGYLLAFFGTRTSDFGSISIRLAGFERRDTVAWIYGSGFPKSLNIGKAIDAAAGAEREVIGRSDTAIGPSIAKDRPAHIDVGGVNWQTANQITAPATDDAKRWDGWGSALKPAFEPIAVFRKPLSEKTIATNVVKHGTGGMNIDVCRVGKADTRRPTGNHALGMMNDDNWKSRPLTGGSTEGRWPANVCHDGSDEVLGLFPETQSGALLPGHKRGSGVTSYDGGGGIVQGSYGNDSGSAARFFFCAQADEADEFADEVKESDGSDKAQKPEFEPIAVFRKPLSEKTIAANVVKHGTGGMNIDGCRVDLAQGEATHGSGSNMGNEVYGEYASERKGVPNIKSTTGRWPANVCHDGSDEVLGLFPDRKSRGQYTDSRDKPGTKLTIYGSEAGTSVRDNAYANEDGSAARFFYCAKVNKAERNEGMNGGTNNHPTLKPTALMRWLVRLVTPRGGTVLDPFMGSGSTGRAAALEKCSFIGCELDPEYVAIAVKRIAAVTNEEIIESVPDLEAEAAKRKSQSDQTLGFLAALLARRKSS